MPHPALLRAATVAAAAGVASGPAFPVVAGVTAAGAVLAATVWYLIWTPDERVAGGSWSPPPGHSDFDADEEASAPPPPPPVEEPPVAKPPVVIGHVNEHALWQRVIRVASMLAVVNNRGVAVAREEPPPMEPLDKDVPAWIAAVVAELDRNISDDFYRHPKWTHMMYDAMHKAKDAFGLLCATDEQLAQAFMLFEQGEGSRYESDTMREAWRVMNYWFLAEHKFALPSTWGLEQRSAEPSVPVYQIL